MQRSKLLLAIGLISLAVMSCTTFRASGLAVAPKGQAVTTVGTFHTTVWVSQFLGGPGGAKLFNITADATDPAIHDAIQREIDKLGGSGAIDITITNHPGFGPILLAWITADIYAPTEVEITGTVIK